MNRGWTGMNAKRRKINPTAAERRFTQTGLGYLLSSFLLTVSAYIYVHPRFVFFFASIRVHSRLILLFGVAALPHSPLQAGRIQQILDLLVIHVFLGHGNGTGV
jgi:hypothetical protein